MIFRTPCIAGLLHSLQPSTNPRQAFRLEQRFNLMFLSTWNRVQGYRDSASKREPVTFPHEIRPHNYIAAMPHEIEHVEDLGNGRTHQASIQKRSFQRIA